MKKQFYTSIIEIDTLFIELDTLTLTDKEKAHLQEILETNLYHTMLDFVLSQLILEDRKLFLEKLAADDHEKTLEFLHKRILNIEEKIKRKAKTFAQEMQEDIMQIKKS